MRRKPFLFLGLSVLSAILHNLIFALSGFEEPFFFILTFVFLFACLAWLVLFFWTWVKKGEYNKISKK